MRYAGITTGWFDQIAQAARFRWVSVLFALVGTAVTATEPVGTLLPVDVAGKRFHLPPDFTMSLAASPELVPRPITAALDELGRLYVSDSSGTNDPVEVQLAQKPHRILRLEDTDMDGDFDRSTLFADGMMFPEGTMWLDGSLYVAAPPQIWKLTDTDEDGKADRREVWFDGKALTRCANELHGPYAGPDGWIYWAKGAFAEQTYPRLGKSPLVTRAAHFLRARPDGSGLEPVMTGGMDNPVDIAFTAGGERIVNGTFFIQPGGGLRDGLIHAVYGGIYGKVHEPIFDPAHKWTGPDVMPVLAHLGPAAPSGLLGYESSAFGPEFVGNLFNTCFNMRKVTRHVLTPQGASFSASSEDFLRCEDLDFHPTDLVEDVDGSLLVIDTGGWYKLCCPTSQLHKPNVYGGIYRIRRTPDKAGRKVHLADADWTTRNAPAMADLLDAPRPAMRHRAMRELERMGINALPALRTTVGSPRSSSLARRNALWVAIRIPLADARTLIREGLRDREEETRQVALHGISLWRDAEAVPVLLELLSHTTSPANARAAAEALGRIGDPEGITPALVERALSVAPGDRHLEHSLTYMLIELGDAELLRDWLLADNAKKLSLDARRLVLTALDQLAPELVDAAPVIDALREENESLRRVAAWIAGRHVEWGPRLVEFWRQELGGELTDADRSRLEIQIAGFVRDSSDVRRFVESSVLEVAAPALRRSGLRIMSRAGLSEPPATWLNAIAAALADPSEATIRIAVAAARSLSLPGDWRESSEYAEPMHTFDAALMRTSTRSDLPLEIRCEALVGMRRDDYEASDELFSELMVACEPEAAAGLREMASAALRSVRLSSQQRERLASAMVHAPAWEMARLLPLFADCHDEAIGATLLASLEQAESTSALRPDELAKLLSGFGPAIQTRVARLLDRLEVDRAARRDTLDALFARMSEGDVLRGQAIYHNPKLACGSCHAMGYVGGTIGPDLSEIGKIRGERDLLESILFPSASFVRSYEPMTCICHDGRVLSGILKNETAEAIVLTVSATEEVRVLRAAVEELRPATVSVMPAGLGEQLTEREIIDLVAFLKSRGN